MKNERGKKLRRRKNATQGRASETNFVILEATRKILREAGFRRVNTNEIARVAGVSIGSLYQYFPNKEAILIECYQQHSNNLLGLMKDIIEQTRGQPIQLVIESIVYALIEAHQFDIALHKAVSEAMTMILGNDKNKDIKAVFFAYIHEVLSEYREEIIPGDFEIACHVFYQTVGHLIHFTTVPNAIAFESKAYLAAIVEQATAYLTGQRSS